MKKRIFAVLTALFLLCACLPLGISANAEGEIIQYGYLRYTVKGGEVIISGCDKSVSTITIPSTIRGCPVTRIGENAFYCCESLTTVTIPNSVTTIDKSAFIYCSSLTSITIPSSVTSIGAYAFFECDSLTNVYYDGGEMGHSAMQIGENNDALRNANWYYEYMVVDTVIDNVAEEKTENPEQAENEDHRDDGDSGITVLVIIGLVNTVLLAVIAVLLFLLLKKKKSE